MYFGWTVRSAPARWLSTSGSNSFMRRAVDLLFATGYKFAEGERKKLKNSVEEARVQPDIARRELDEHRLFVNSKPVDVLSNRFLPSGL